jgi:hypothetical protein
MKNPAVFKWATLTMNSQVNNAETDYIIKFSPITAIYPYDYILATFPPEV